MGGANSASVPGPATSSWSALTSRRTRFTVRPVATACRRTPRNVTSAASTTPCREAAMERAIALLIEVAGGAAGPVVATERRAHLPERRSVRLRRRRLDLLVGEVVPDRDVDRIFERLEFAPRRHDGEDGPSGASRRRRTGSTSPSRRTWSKRSAASTGTTGSGETTRPRHCPCAGFPGTSCPPPGLRTRSSRRATARPSVQLRRAGPGRAARTGRRGGAHRQPDVGGAVRDAHQLAARPGGRAPHQPGAAAEPCAAVRTRAVLPGRLGRGAGGLDGPPGGGHRLRFPVRGVLGDGRGRDRLPRPEGGCRAAAGGRGPRPVGWRPAAIGRCTRDSRRRCS